MMWRGPQYYLYLRTRLDLDNMGEEFPDLSSVCEKARLLSLDRGVDGWRNGIVLRFNTADAEAEIVEKLQAVLAGHDWLVTDTAGFESGSLGFATPDMLRFGLRPAQAFFMSSDDGPLPNRQAQAIRDAFGAYQVEPLFHFADGLVLGIASNEPARLLARRAERALQSLDLWAICDASDETIGSRRSSPRWQLVDTADLWFGPSDEDEGGDS